MKNIAVMCLVFCICSPVLGEEEIKTTVPSITIGGGVFSRYLHLDLNHWKDARGERLPQRDLVFSGGRLLICGPIGSGGVRWRVGGLLGYAGKSEGDDVDDLQLGMVAGGIASGLSWRPGKFGLSADLTVGGSGIVTEFKRVELARDWDTYERRSIALFYWEPLLSLDWQVADIFVIRLQGGYTFLYGRGEEVGGFTGGLAFDFGRWI